MSPYNFFNFTPDGFRLMFQQAGLAVKSIEPEGGVFTLLAIIVRSVPRHLLRQHNTGWKRPFAICAYAVSLPFFGLLFPFALSCFDFLDRKCEHTIGNHVIAEKPKTGVSAP